MTPQQQRIAIAEACGFVWMIYRPSGKRTLYPPHPTPREGSGWCFCASDENGNIDSVPDYPHDLNAIRQAITSTLTETVQREAFMWRLRWTVHKDEWAYTLPTPEQWCEAFLRTIGKWVDQPGKETP